MKKFLLAASIALACALGFGSALVSAADAPKAMPENIFVDLSKKIVPSVVNISTLTTIKAPYGSGSSPDDMFRKFFDEYMHRHDGEGDEDQDEGPPQKGTPQHAMSLGTGFIIDSSGLILTNNHVVADADEIKIAFTEETDEKPTTGEVVGRDLDLDVALIRVKSKRKMVQVVLGDSDDTEVGEYVIAVGNPFGQGHSVTHGIISAKGRFAPDFPIATYIQTDAPINPGNSGGPLVNLKGEVIGINNAIDQRAQGIGFAIPISAVKKILPQLRSKGTVARGYIGVLVGEVTPEIAPKLGVSKDLSAPFVTHVYPGEPADKAGIKPYDIILEFNGKAMHGSRDLITAVTGVSVGESVAVKVSRDGKDLALTIKVAQRPGAKQLEEKNKPKGKKDKKKAPKVDTGMQLDDMTPEVARDLGAPATTEGVVVSSVEYGSAADRAGLMRGDIILEVDRKTVKDADEFYEIVHDKKSYLLRVRRQDPQGNEAFAVIVLDLKS